MGSFTDWSSILPSNWEGRGTRQGFDLINIIEIAGSPQEAGVALGRFGADIVHQHLVHTQTWQSVMRWRGSQVVATMAMLVRERFPRIWAELQGLAEGLRLSFEDTFLWNCRGDVGAMSTEGCTTVQLPGADLCQISHNEDGDPALAGHCGLAQCRIEGSPAFLAFVYPGSLPGHTFAVTDAGLTMTVNNLRPRGVVAGVPRMVLSRAALEARDLDTAVAVLRDQPRAGGFHLTLGHCVRPRLLSVEYHAYRCSVREVVEPSLHANHAIHPAMRGFPQVITASSFYRQRRGDVMLAQARRAGQCPDPLVILADQADTMFPIYRNDPDDPDSENTLATACITIRPTHSDLIVQFSELISNAKNCEYQLVGNSRQPPG